MQKYVHDLTVWDALPVEQQERAIGRTKLSDIEMPDDVKPPNSHVALNTIVDDDGNERQIMRYNMPFGAVGTREFGTYFIGYAASPDVIEQMLTNMFIGNPPGTYDRILDFSTALTGNLFFVPTLAFLDDPPEPGAELGAVSAGHRVGRVPRDREPLGPAARNVKGCTPEMSGAAVHTVVRTGRISDGPRTCKPRACARVQSRRRSRGTPGRRGSLADSFAARDREVVEQHAAEFRPAHHVVAGQVERAADRRELWVGGEADERGGEVGREGSVAGTGPTKA